MRRSLIARFAEHGALVQPDALELILSRPDPGALAERVLSALRPGQMVVGVADVRAQEGSQASSVRTGGRERPGETAPPASQASAPEPPSGDEGPLPPSESAPEPEEAEELPAQVPLPLMIGAPAPSPESAPGITILKDVTGRSTCQGQLEDFVRYFNDRLGRLKRLLRGRRELVGSAPINSIRRSRSEREVRFVGMVSSIRRTHKGRVLAELEDETGSMTVLLPEETPKHRMGLMKDEVVGVVGKLAPDGGIVYVQSLVRPETPLGREPRRSAEPSVAAFISDIHVGSKTFLDKDWKRFTDWLRGRGDRHQDYGRRLKYLVICGDVVDGIGIYPDQEEDLAIRDVYAQYQALAELLKEVPERIRVIMLPGNHDAVRPAEPQPTFPEEITRLFDPGICFVGNPCHFRLEGVEVLAYHGMSMVDFVSSLPNLSFTTPIEVMKEMLKRRHLAPAFGEKTPIAPEDRDWMVVDTIPDIFVTGHVHFHGVENHRGVLLVNASTWQSQTDYQRMMNFNPQPSRVALVDLRTLNWRTLDFSARASG